MPSRPLHPDDADAGHVARLFGKSRQWVYRAMPALEAMGFPPPRPRITAYGAARGPIIWPRAEVEAWVEAYRRGGGPTANDNGRGPADALAARRARLLGRL